MNKVVLGLILVLSYGQASSVSLKDILTKADENSPMQQALLQESLSNEALYKADHAPNPLTLYGTAGKAKPQLGANANEYTVGISKQILIGGVESLDDDIAALNKQADAMEGEKEILSFQNGLKELYHKHCIQKENTRSVQALYNEFETLYAKKEKAFGYGEISKIELLRLKMEKEKLLAMLKEAKASASLSQSALFKLSRTPQRPNTSLSCSDIYPIFAAAPLKGEVFSLSEGAYKNRLKSAQKMLTRNSTPLESVEVSAEYNNELDMQRYIVGVSVPLNFTSKKSEQKRLEALHQSAAVEARHRQNSIERNTMLFTLQTELEQKSEAVARIRKSIDAYKTQLLPLLQKSYDYGESSVTEFILNKQQYYDLLQEFYKAKKAYYHTLFTLYTLSETKDTL